MRRVLLWLLILPAVPAAAVGAERFNVDFGVGWQGCYRPLEWTPVEIGISSRLSKPFGGALTISAQQDELSTLTISHPIVLTRDLRLYLPLVTKFAFSGEDCVVRITDERGRVRWRRSYSLWDSPGGPQGLNAVGTNELLIGVSGQMLFGLAFLPKHSKCRSGEQTGKVHVKLKLERLLPWDWTGYVSLDLLVLYNVDWSLLRSEQVEAIVEWISNGGRLLLVLGSHPLPAKHPLAALLPLPLGQPTQVEIDRNTLTRWGVRKTRKRTVTCWLRHDSPGDRRSITAPPIFAHGPVGFGHVGVFGADPSVLGGEQKGNLAPFWIAHVKPLLCGRTLKAGSAEDSEESDDYYPYTYQLGDAGAGSDAVLNHLLNVKQLRPISIWWVVLLLVTLAVLLGPVDYLVLKRFGRLPLTWVTSACYVALFSVGAYYGVRALRGGRLQVRVVSVSDGIAGQETAWSTRYSGIFAPAGHDYKLAGLGPRDWWSGIAPHGGYLEEEHTWGRRQIYCLQHDGANSVTSVPISIWSM